MNGLSTNVRTHVLHLTHDRDVRLTFEQYKAIKASQAIDKWNDPLEIRDPDTGKMLHDGLMKDILGFDEIEVDPNAGNRRFVCDFGTRHTIHEDCHCTDKYRMPPILFTDTWMRMFPKKNYVSSLSPAEIKATLDAIYNHKIPGRDTQKSQETTQGEVLEGKEYKDSSEE